MKKLITLLALIIVFASCQKQNNTPTNASSHTTPPASTTSTLTIMVNSATITAGQSVILSASGATSYTWSTGATTNTISVAPSLTTSYTVTGTTAGNTGTAVSMVTVISNTTTSKDSVWFNLKFTLPTPTLVTSLDTTFAKSFKFFYDTNTVRLYLNGHKINAASYGTQIDFNDGSNNGWLVLAQNIQNTAAVLKTPILMNKYDSLTLEVDSVYCFFNSNIASNFVDLLIDKNGHIPYNNTQLTTTEKTCTYNDVLTNVTANGTSLRWIGAAPINGQNAQQSWYIGGKYRCTWVNH